jgi:hypothetical protein
MVYVCNTTSTKKIHTKHTYSNKKRGLLTVAWAIVASPGFFSNMSHDVQYIVNLLIG